MPAKDPSTNDADIWMHLVRRLFYWTCPTDSGCPLVIMVESTQDRNSHRLVRCTMRGKSRSSRFGKLLLNTLMRSCLIEVRSIPMSMRWSCFSRKINRWSRHSCLTLLKKRSQTALARGA
jgi:hypothetical protein